MRGVQFLRSADGSGRATVHVRMKLFGKHTVGGADLRQRAAAVQAERGVMIVFRAFQSPSLTGGGNGVTFIKTEIRYPNH